MGEKFWHFWYFSARLSNLTRQTFKALQGLVKDSDHPSKYFPSNIWKKSVASYPSNFTPLSKFPTLQYENVYVIIQTHPANIYLVLHVAWSILFLGGVREDLQGCNCTWWRVSRLCNHIQYRSSSTVKCWWTVQYFLQDSGNCLRCLGNRKLIYLWLHY